MILKLHFKKLTLYERHVGLKSLFQEFLANSFHLSSSELDIGAGRKLVDGGVKGFLDSFREETIEGEVSGQDVEGGELDPRKSPVCRGDVDELQGKLDPEVVLAGGAEALVPLIEARNEDGEDLAEDWVEEGNVSPDSDGDLQYLNAEDVIQAMNAHGAILEDSLELSIVADESAEEICH